MRSIFIFIVLAFASLTPVSLRADLDWIRVAAAGYQALQAYSLSDEDVIEYVKQTVDYMDDSHTVLPPSSPYSKRLNRLVAGLDMVDGVKLNFRVYEIRDEVNAFACADGSVRVYSSLMDLMTDEELLGVIGHEIGHVGMHHSRKALKKALMTDALREAIASSSGSLGRLADSGLGYLGQTMLNAKYSRTQEKEADDYGYDFLKKRGHDPRGMIKALEKLQSLEQQSSKMAKYISSMFSSHPDIEERIARLKQRYDKDRR